MLVLILPAIFSFLAFNNAAPLEPNSTAATSERIEFTGEIRPVPSRQVNYQSDEIRLTMTGFGRNGSIALHPIRPVTTIIEQSPQFSEEIEKLMSSFMRIADSLSAEARNFVGSVGTTFHSAVRGNNTDVDDTVVRRPSIVRKVFYGATDEFQKLAHPVKEELKSALRTILSMLDDGDQPASSLSEPVRRIEVKHD